LGILAGIAVCIGCYRVIWHFIMQNWHIWSTVEGLNGPYVSTLDKLLAHILLHFSNVHLVSGFSKSGPIDSYAVKSVIGTPSISKIIKQIVPAMRQWIGFQIINSDSVGVIFINSSWKLANSSFCFIKNKHTTVMPQQWEQCFKLFIKLCVLSVKIHLHQCKCPSISPIIFHWFANWLMPYYACQHNNALAINKS